MNAGLEAKYHYEFWRPVTAIRSGDSGGNPHLAGDPAWERSAPHRSIPEYPCANCIVAAAETVMKAFFGSDTVPEFSLSTPTAAGVTHRWTRLDDYMQEGVERTDLGGHPLLLLDPGRHGDGTEDRRVHNP
jgi:hypothetical protein